MKLSDVKKYLKNKVLVVGIIALLIVGGVYSTLNLRSKLSAVRSELVASKSLYSIIEGEKNRLESLIPLYKDSIAKRDVVIATKEKKINSQLKEINTLQDSLKHTLIDVGNITADESYRYINQRIMPKSERKYPFDSVQVKAIHYTFVERDGLFTINNKLNITIFDLRQLSSVKDNQITDLNKLNDVYLQRGDLCKKENEAYVIEIQGLNKSVKQQKFMKNAGIGVTLGLVTYILVNSFTK
jgi:hypothetical protein